VGRNEGVEHGIAAPPLPTPHSPLATSAGFIALRSERRDELAGSKGVEGAEAGAEFGAGQALLAVEPAKEVGRRALALLRIAFEAAGNQIAVGIVSGADARNDVVRHITKGVRRFLQ